MYPLYQLYQVYPRSHQNAWTPLAHGLAKAGHSVTMVTTVPCITDLHPGITEVVITCKEFQSFSEEYSGLTSGVWDSIQMVLQGGKAVMKVL